MKIKLFTFLLSILILGIVFSCNKDHLENPHNHDLLKKSLSEIKAEIAGNWQIQYDISNGVAGSIKTIHNNDYVSFLSNDTVRQIENNIVTLYEKAVISKRYSYAYNDSAYVYSMQGGFLLWSMQKIKNDTLIMHDGSQITNYLTRH